jgi:ribosomal protein S18 acetylase RimI-like enzyme
MQIRPIINQQELGQTSAIFQRTWQAAYRELLPAAGLQVLQPGDWEAGLVRPGRHNLVAQVDGQLVGVVSYGVPRNPQRFLPDTGELMALYVLPEYEGQGIGTQLLAQAEAALATQFSRADLLVLEGNSAARSFYQRHGWRATGEMINQVIFGRPVRLLQYEKFLKK